MRRTMSAAVAAAMCLAACGGDGVSGPAVVTVSITIPKSVIAVGESIQALAAPLDVTGNAVIRTVTWGTSAASVATVSSTGVITGVGQGTATIDRKSVWSG